MPVHHAEGIPEPPPSVLGGTQRNLLARLGSDYFFSLKITASHLNAVNVKRKNKISNQQNFHTAELDWTNLFLPSLSAKEQESLVWGVTSFLCQPAEGGTCADEHVFSL